MPLGAFRLNSLGRFTAPAGRTALTITTVGNAQVDTAQSKFGGASALFDGTSDYLTVSAGGFNVGTGDITLEAWVRHAVINDQQVYFDTRSNQNGFAFYMRSDNKLEVYDGLSTYTSVATMAATTLYHLALSRSGSSLKVYRDGTEVISGSNSRNLSDNSSIVIGSSYEGFSTNSMNGHMDEIRISKTARYTAGFTPSTSPFVNDADTLLLLHCNGTDATTVFTDDVGTNAQPRTPNTITARGNAQVSTAQSKFGGASMLSDGAGDCLQVSSNADFGYSTGDFTIEFFIRPTTNLTSTYNVWEQRADGEAGAVKPSIYISGSTIYYYTNSNNAISHSVTLQSGTWYHIALSRSGTSTKMFLDGTQVGSTYTDSNSYATSQVVIGAYSTGGGGFSGSTPAYFDEIRISNSARYTTTFTPTAAAFVNDRNTLLLIHANGTNASTTFTDDNA
jgi:hypothetical protein